MMVGVEITNCDFKLGRAQDEKTGGVTFMTSFGFVQRFPAHG
jgi:hypothetical protein